MVEFRSLASSSSGCAYVLTGDGGKSQLLIECGIRFPALQRALHFDFGAVAGALVSHAHSDHSRSAKHLERHAVPVFASKETIAEVRLRDTWRPLEHLQSRYIGDWFVTPFNAVHDCPGTLGFVIQGFSSRCLYLSDSAYSPYRFDGLTHIFVECNHSAAMMRETVRRGQIDPERYRRTVNNHMSLETLLGFLEANDLSSLREVHLLHLSDFNSDEVAFANRVREATGCPVYVASKQGTPS